MWNEIQTTSCWIWTWLAESISYNDNRYAFRFNLLFGCPYNLTLYRMFSFSLPPTPLSLSLSLSVSNPKSSQNNFALKWLKKSLIILHSYDLEILSSTKKMPHYVLMTMIRGTETESEKGYKNNNREMNRNMPEGNPEFPSQDSSRQAPKLIKQIECISGNRPTSGD